VGATGVFLERTHELKLLGDWLTSVNRPRIITIQGGGGQGKTALAREAVERFAYAWPGGVWATSLEDLPSRETFVTNLALFLGITIQKVRDTNALERLVLAQLTQRRILIVLDDAETLLDALEVSDSDDTKALSLAQFVKHLAGPMVSLLVTSRVRLGWSGEATLELGGLSPKEGASLFQQSAPQRTSEINLALAETLSEKVEGHPLSLHLLGGAFNSSTMSLNIFVQEYGAQLTRTENKYVGVEHRHRTLYASIDTSVNYLDADLRKLFSGLWIFYAPFLVQTAVAIFDPEADATENISPVENYIFKLWQRGLLDREIVTVRDGTLLFYRLLPPIRLYVQKYLEQSSERDTLLARFGVVYARVAEFLYQTLDKSAVAATIAQQTLEDLERGIPYVTGIEQGYYLLHFAWILHRLGEPQRGLMLLERALKIAHGQDRYLEVQSLNNMAAIYRATGQPQRALDLYEQMLNLTQEGGDRAGEATTLNNLALVYQDIGQPQRALDLNKRASLIMNEIGDRAGEATTLNNMALVYQTIGQPQRALALYEQALPLRREVGDRAGEATTLNNVAEAYRMTGQFHQALELYEQALLIMNEVGDRAGEATTLNNLALVYQAIGEPQRALTLYEQTLPLRREVGDRAGEATTLNNLARVYQAIGEPQRALTLYEQALNIRQEIGDRAGEATTLNNLARVYQAIGEPQRALTLYEQILPLRREVGDRAGEATTLNNLAGAYQVIGEPQRALTLYEQALSICREIGDRSSEAAILHGLAYLFQELKRYRDAQAAFEQSITIEQQAFHPEGEAAGLVGLALLLYQHLSHNKEAIMLMEQALEILKNAKLSRDAAGSTIEDYLRILKIMRSGLRLSNLATMPNAEIQQIVDNTISVMTKHKKRRTEWREIIAKALQDAQKRGSDFQIEVDFLNAVLVILDERSPSLPTDHPYAQAVAAIQDGISAGGLQEDDIDNKEKDSESDESDIFQLIIQNTIAVLGPAQEKRDEWHQVLTELREQAKEAGVQELNELLNAVIQLLDAEGNSAALGKDLKGVYAQTWKKLVEQLAEQGIASG
jgi:tetratricopeptide (TPR) repeat protein